MTRCGLVILETHGVTLSPVGMWKMENAPNLPGDFSQGWFPTTTVCCKHYLIAPAAYLKMHKDRNK